MPSSRGSFQPREFWDFPGGTMDRNPPASTGDTRIQPLVQEDSTCLGANKLMHQNYGDCALEPVLRNKRSHCNEKPAHHNKKPQLARARESLHPARKIQHHQK